MLESNKKRAERKKREAAELAAKRAADQQAIVERFSPHDVPFKDEPVVVSVPVVEAAISAVPTPPTYKIRPDTTIGLAVLFTVLILVIL